MARLRPSTTFLRLFLREFVAFMVFNWKIHATLLGLFFVGMLLLGVLTLL